MLELYEGVEYTIAIPNHDMNQKIKEVIHEAEKQLECKLRVSIEEAYEEMGDLGINCGDYFLSFTTPGFKESWEKEDLVNTGYRIKAIMGNPVYIKTYGPYEYCTGGSSEEK